MDERKELAMRNAILRALMAVMSTTPPEAKVTMNEYARELTEEIINEINRAKIL